MKNFIAYFKRNVYFMVSIITVFVSVVFAVTIFIVNNISDQPAQTTVGTIYLGGQNRSQYEAIINNEVQTFLNQAIYEVEYQGEKVEVSLDLFSLDVPRTVNTIVEDQKNDLVFDMTEQNLIYFRDELKDSFTENVANLVDMGLLVDTMIIDLSSMSSKKVYALEDFFLYSAYETLLNEYTMTKVTDLDDINQITNEMEFITIAPKSQFSLLDALGMLDLNNEQLSIVANGMLNVLMKSHMDGFTFETYTHIPTWSDEGFIVRILKVNDFDFTFYNAYGFEYKIEVEKTDANLLSFSLIGTPYINTYDYEVKLKTIVPSEIIYVENTLLDETTPGVIITDTEDEIIYHLPIEIGEDGKIVEIIRTITDSNDESTSIKLYDLLYRGTLTTYEEHIVEKDGA